jgi:SAM-dependent methyltransferase
MLDPVLQRRYLNKVQIQLMTRKRWAYLRYLQMREGLIEALKTAGEIKSFLSVGCGAGLTEVALALEFPAIEFYLTDIDTKANIQQRLGIRMATEWVIENVKFDTYDTLTPSSESYDLVASIEVLEHIEADKKAAINMRAASRKYVFALVPFASHETNLNKKMRESVWKNHQHYRVGYNADSIQEIFPDITILRGCYWNDAGIKLRQKLEHLSDEEIRALLPHLTQLAKTDIRNSIPGADGNCHGMWILSKV